MTNELLAYCNHATQREDFVGIRFDYDETLEHYRPFITFPYGYEISSNDDILCLIRVLDDYKQEIKQFSTNPSDMEQGFPLGSYMMLIQDYLQNGYYAERETVYASRSHGKVNWGRTVKKERPILQHHGAIYFNLQTRLHHANDEHIMSEISKHCVYESFAKLGWFYGLSTPAKPTSQLQKPLFIAILQDKLHKANKDMDKQLFGSMMNVLNNADETEQNPQYFNFGTRRFEKVWEYLIDKMFGTEQGENKKKYFPKASWHITDDECKDSNPLLPDTIMINRENHDAFVIDAKYYRFGITKKAEHLPNMSSIAKQITYAEFIHQQFNFNRVFNVFILPFNTSKADLKTYHCSGRAVADWLDDCDYKYIYAVLLDTKYLMQNQTFKNADDIKSLSDLLIKFNDS
ncbi:MAG: LlaJI family restriction endonuclease [Myroides sp.]|nr:LlaJI family restriction endonuclease [Myroides sp.]